MVIFTCVRKIANSDCWLRHVCPSFSPSVLPLRITQFPLDGFSWNSIFEGFLENLPRKIKFHSNMTRIAGTLHEDLCTFRIISRWILLGMRNVSDNICRENQKTYIMFSNFFLRKSCRFWDNVEKYGRDIQAKHDNTIQRMRFVCWITKATDTNGAYVMLTAFARQ